jgi:hypothetical protein
MYRSRVWARALLEKMEQLTSSSDRYILVRNHVYQFLKWQYSYSPSVIAGIRLEDENKWDNCIQNMPQ